MKHACTHWHYSGCLPVGKLVKIGVWEDDVFIGAVIFSRGASAYALDRFRLKQTQGCELTRVALRQHVTPVSRILSIALKMLKKMFTEMQLVISYADVDQNHHGGIYQAGNWIYTGVRAENTKPAFIIYGRKTHRKSVHTMGMRASLETVRARTDPNATFFLSKGKHCYLMPLNDVMRSQVEHLKQPYPKREKHAMADTLGTAAVRLRPSRSIESTS